MRQVDEMRRMELLSRRHEHEKTKAAIEKDLALINEELEILEIEATYSIQEYGLNMQAYMKAAGAMREWLKNTRMEQFSPYGPTRSILLAYVNG